MLGAALYLAALALAIRGAAGAFTPWGKLQDGLIGLVCLLLVLLAMVCVATGLEQGLAKR